MLPHQPESIALNAKRMRCSVNLVIGLLLAAITATTAPVAAETAAPKAAAEKIPVFLQTDARDAVGAAYVAKLREALAGSSAYRSVATPSSARFVVGIVTMDPNEADSSAGVSQSTVAAVTLQRENAPGLNQFVYSWVLVAKRDKVDSLATELLSAIDQEIHGLEGVMTIRFLDEEASAAK